MIITHDVGWALISALLAYGFGICVTTGALSARDEPRRWLGLCIRWFSLFGVAYAVMASIVHWHILPHQHTIIVWRLTMAASGAPSVFCLAMYAISRYQQAAGPST